MFTKMGKCYTKTRRNFKKHASSSFLSGMITVRSDANSSWGSIWWCYITPVSSISCLNIYFCQLFHWPKNVNKPNLVFLHILECTIRNTFLTNINLGRLSDIASHCKKYINILSKSRFYHIFVYLILYFTFILQQCEWDILRDL